MASSSPVAESRFDDRLEIWFTLRVIDTPADRLDWVQWALADRALTLWHAMLL
jgi:hypothetical protein